MLRYLQTKMSNCVAELFIRSEKVDCLFRERSEERCQ